MTYVQFFTFHPTSSLPNHTLFDSVYLAHPKRHLLPGCLPTYHNPSAQQNGPPPPKLLAASASAPQVKQLVRRFSLSYKLVARGHTMTIETKPLQSLLPILNNHPQPSFVKAQVPLRKSVSISNQVFSSFLRAIRRCKQARPMRTYVHCLPVSSLTLQRLLHLFIIFLINMGIRVWDRLFVSFSPGLLKHARCACSCMIK